MLSEVAGAAAEVDAAFDFSQALQRFFVGGALLSEATNSSMPRDTIARVGGNLSIGTAQFPSSLTAKCWFDVGVDWTTQQPTLWCLESWIQRGKDRSERTNWHIYEDRSLCYVLRDQWADWLIEVERAEGPSKVPYAAAFYAVNNLCWLLHHHLEAYRRRLPRWDPKWPEWPHGFDDARRAYEYMRRYGR